MGVLRTIAKKSISKKTIDDISAAIHAGRLIIVPATSCYVLACDAQNASAITDLNLLRENSEDYILSLIFPSLASMDTEVTVPELNLDAKKYLESGQLTLVLPRDDSVRVESKKYRELVAVNIPVNPNVRRLLEFTGPWVVASAAAPGKGLPRSVNDISASIKNGVEYIVDAGPISGTVSSVVNFASKKPTISRIGAITEEIIHELFVEV